VIGQWDDEEKMWRTERIKDPEYNLGMSLCWHSFYCNRSTCLCLFPIEERTVSFKTLFFSPIALFVVSCVPCLIPLTLWVYSQELVNIVANHWDGVEWGVHKNS